MPSPVEQLEDLRRLAKRYGLPVDLVDRLTLRRGEVARMTGFGLRTVDGWIQSGQLEVLDLPGGKAIPVTGLLRFLESRKRSTENVSSRSTETRARALLSSPPRRSRAGVGS